MAWLRDRQHGCPWDIDQTFRTIVPYTIEEAYEVADAIERDDLPALKEELGDLLLQVVYHSQMASEAKAFAFDDVAAAIAEKMIDRHPHVFGDHKIANADAQTVSWEARKAAERARRPSLSRLAPWTAWLAPSPPCCGPRSFRSGRHASLRLGDHWAGDRQDRGGAGRAACRA